MTRLLRKAWPLAALVLLLTGCGSKAKITEERSGIWDTYFVGPLSDTLDWFADHLWGQYGLSILIVTIIIRFIVLPLTLKQYKSSKAMQALQPQMAELKKKYKDDPKKQQEETMKLFQTHGVNPLAGCLPIFIQMPILIALYSAISRNPDIYHSTFLWLKLGEKDPYYILPILAALTTFLQQKVMMASNPTQQPGMQAMLFVFPVMIFVMSMQFAAALPLYWVFSNTFTIVQTYIIYRPSKKVEVAQDGAKKRRNGKNG